MHFAFALPDATETGGGGGADYIEGLADGLRQNGAAVDILRGNDPAFPPGAVPIVDGMLLPLLHGRLDALASAGAVALVHHVAAASGRDEVSRARTRAIEAQMLPRMHAIVATSAPVAERLATTFGITAHALPPGTRDRLAASPDPNAPLILSVGVLTRRKRHEHLLQAASRLLDLPWRLVIAGDTQRDPARFEELNALARELALSDRVEIVADPTPERLESVWRRATVFALATAWEGYPTAVAEAMSRGVPTLTTAGANAAAILPPAAGAICPDDDVTTFGKCLRRLLFDDALRADMAAAAQIAGQALPRWTERARDFASLLEQHS